MGGLFIVFCFGLVRRPFSFVQSLAGAWYNVRSCWTQKCDGRNCVLLDDSQFPNARIEEVG